MEIKRYLTESILEDLNKKMVFIGGARQVGKTTLAKKILAENFEVSKYYNWDLSSDRKKLKKLEFPGEDAFLIFDELHKYKTWKSFIKGIYDSYKTKYKIVVTGSARLNIYRKGGDSLQGRYHYYTLHPFSLSELAGNNNKIVPMQELIFNKKSLYKELEILYKFGGFPEPLISQNEKTLRRWHIEKLERLFREDIRDIENIRDMGNMKLLGDMLPSKAAGIISINSLREDLEVSHRAVTNWLNILEQFYYHFRIQPFASTKYRSLKKDSKIYLTDWSEIENEGARFENLIASHLLKTISFLKESEGYNLNLNYLRNTEKKEVDFLITNNNKPWFAVEVKLNETNPSPNLFYFREKLKIPFVYQVVLKKDIDINKENIRIISADKFLSALF